MHQKAKRVLQQQRGVHCPSRFSNETMREDIVHSGYDKGEVQEGGIPWGFQVMGASMALLSCKGMLHRNVM
jgi:hypothetical protein